MRRSAALIALLLPSLAVAQQPSAVPGRLYDIGGLSLHMRCIGPSSAAGPTVVFDSGLGGFSLEWLKIQHLLADELQSCAYDRAGYGWSELGPPPRTTSQIDNELHRLLEVAAIPPPYILVGQSFGGYNVQYFAKAHPGEVAGVVLVDSSHPAQAERISEVTVAPELGSRPHVVTLFYDISILEKYPPDVRDSAMMLLSSRKAMVTQQRELASFNYSASEVEFLGDDFPDVPLVVVTRGRMVWPDTPLGIAREKQWQAMQKELVQLSPQGRQVIAEQSGHMIHLDQPELIAGVIRDMVHGLRSQKAITGR